VTAVGEDAVVGASATARRERGPLEPPGLGVLAVPALINAIGARTEFGGARLNPSACRAMAEESVLFKDVDTVMAAAGADIARLSRNQAALVCAGSSCGLFLAVTAALCAGDRLAPERLRRHPPQRRDIVVDRKHRFPLDRSVQVAGGHFVEIGDAIGTRPAELEAVIGSAAAVVYIAGDYYERLSLPLADVVRIAAPAGVPVIVDAAGQLPPVRNLWRYTAELGATAAIFSGGKDLGAPHSTGFIAGEADFIAGCSAVAFPRPSIGRAMKVSKEEAVGLAVALAEYVELDHDTRRARARAALDLWAAELAPVTHMRTWVDEEDYFPQLAAQASQGAPFGGRELQAALRTRGVAAGLVGSNDILVLCAQCVEPAEETMVASALRASVDELTGAAGRWAAAGPDEGAAGVRDGSVAHVL
jgi:L-seryl-tRNA(Ser) seleniumtransferase